MPLMIMFQSSRCNYAQHLRFQRRYLKGGTFDSNRVMTAWNEKLDRALDRGYAGLRGTGNTAWLQKKDWKAFSEYEQLVNDSVVGRSTILSCAYSLNSCGANELLDVVANRCAQCIDICQH